MHVSISFMCVCICCFAVDETLDDILAGSDEEEESAQLVSQVLDEIGLDTASKVNRYSIVMSLSIYNTILCCLGWF